MNSRAMRIAGATAVFGAIVGAAISRNHGEVLFAAQDDVGSNPAIATPTPGDQQKAWDVLSAFANDMDQANPPMQGLGNAPWHSVCEVIDGSCSGVGVLRNTAISMIPMKLRVPIPIFHGARNVSSKESAENSTTTPSAGNLSETVFYNEGASERLNGCSQGNCPANTNFQKGDMIGRFSWYLIPNRKNEGCKSIQIFDPTSGASFSPNRWVVVQTPNCTPPAVGTTVSNCNTATAGTGMLIIPIGCFFYVQISGQKMIDAFPNTDSLTINRGDYILIVGFHLIKNNSDNPSTSPTDWTWTTFWWSANPGLNAGSQATTGYSCAANPSCPDNLKGRFWQSYIMNTVVVPQSGQVYSAASNPYVDLDQPVQSNCIVCHSYAIAPFKEDSANPRSKYCGAHAADKLTPDALLAAVRSYESTCSIPPTVTDGIITLAASSKTPAGASCSFDCGTTDSNMLKSIKGIGK